MTRFFERPGAGIRRRGVSGMTVGIRQRMAAASIGSMDRLLLKKARMRMMLKELTSSGTIKAA